jgi:hypothetical protein
MPGNTLWSTSNGDVPASDIGMAVLQAANATAAQAALEVLPAPSGAVPAYSIDPEDLADALVRAGLMQAE